MRWSSYSLPVNYLLFAHFRREKMSSSEILRRELLSETALGFVTALGWVVCGNPRAESHRLRVDTGKYVPLSCALLVLLCIAALLTAIRAYSPKHVVGVGEYQASLVPFCIPSLEGSRSGTHRQLYLWPAPF